MNGARRVLANARPVFFLFLTVREKVRWTFEENSIFLRSCIKSFERCMCGLVKIKIRAERPKEKWGKKLGEKRGRCTNGGVRWPLEEKKNGGKGKRATEREDHAFRGGDKYCAYA